MSVARRELLTQRAVLRRYYYYVDDFADRQHGGYEDYRPCAGPGQAKPRRATCETRLSYSEFRALSRKGDGDDSRYYLQTPLMLAAETPDAPGAVQIIAGHAMQLAEVGDALRDDLLQGIAASRVAALVAAGGLGRWTRTQFFASDRGAVSQLHYDQYANLFVQVAGHKRFALVAPDGARALRPFPVHHPLDAYARADLTEADGPPGASRAREVVLGPGELLYIPSHWWHHVQTLDDGCVSVNFWFSIEHLLVAPPPRLSAPLQLELARQAEYLVADLLGPRAVGPFFWHLERELAETDEPRATEPEPPHWLELQNYFVLQLGRVIGPEQVPRFVRCYLPYSRFEGLGQPVRS